MNPSALLEQSVWASIAAAGFAILFNVPPHMLGACALSGSLAFVARGGIVGVRLGSLELASLYASTLISLLSLAWARRYRVPALVFVIPAVIPLVPGALAFRTVKDLLILTSQSRHEDTMLLASVVTNGFKIILVTSAMALGVALPSIVLRREDPRT